MEVTIESDTLFEAYDAAQTEEAKEAIRDAIVGGREVGALDFASLYPQSVESIDAEEIVAELKKDDEPMNIDEAKEYLNEQVNADFGAVIKSEHDERDLYVSARYPDDGAVDHFDTPDGWTAIEEDCGGVGFVREEEEEETIIVAVHNTGVAESCINQLPDCNHSQVDGKHYAWAVEGSEAADTLQRVRLTQPAENRGVTREELEDNTVPRTAEEAVEAIQESDYNGAAHITGTGHEDKQPYTISDDEHIPCGWERDFRGNNHGEHLRFSP